MPIPLTNLWCAGDMVRHGVKGSLGELQSFPADDISGNQRDTHGENCCDVVLQDLLYKMREGPYTSILGGGGELQYLIPSTMQTVLILSAMTVLSILLIDLWVLVTGMVRRFLKVSLSRSIKNSIAAMTPMTQGRSSSTP